MPCSLFCLFCERDHLAVFFNPVLWKGFERLRQSSIRETQLGKFYDLTDCDDLILRFSLDSKLSLCKSSFILSSDLAVSRL